MTRVGLTGNYGMGKTLVLGLFRDLGAFTISTDAIVAELLEKESVLEKVRGLFGDSVFGPGGRLLKEKVAGIVFADDDRKKALEDILHPLVFDRMEEMIAEREGKIEGLAPGAEGGIVAVEIPLLFEGGYEGRFQKIVTVYSDVSIAITRLEEAGVKREDAAARITSQMPVEEKIRRSDFTIDNSGTRDETRKRVKQIYDALRNA